MAFFPAVTGGLGWRGDGQFAGLRDERKLRGAPAFCRQAAPIRSYCDRAHYRFDILGVLPKQPLSRSRRRRRLSHGSSDREVCRVRFNLVGKRDILSGSLSAIKFFVTLLKSEIALHID